MGNNSKYTNTYVCGILLDDFQRAFDQYKGKTEAGDLALPSLPHFLSTLPEYVGEDDLQAYLTENAERRGTTQNGVRFVKRVLQWFRGQYLSNSGWSGQQAQKAMLALGQNFGDGISYSNKEKKKKDQPDILRVRFGTDEMAQNAGK